MMKKIKLRFDNTLTRLAGFQLGQKIYKEQVSSNWDGSELAIQFPERIEKVATSFVQGFFSDLVNEIGYDRIRNDIKIEASSDKLVSEIWDRLY